MVKAFTAVEIEYMINKAGLTLKAGLEKLKNAGLESIPGGGRRFLMRNSGRRFVPKKPSRTNGSKFTVLPINLAYLQMPQYFTDI